MRVVSERGVYIAFKTTYCANKSPLRRLIERPKAVLYCNLQYKTLIFYFVFILFYDPKKQKIRRALAQRRVRLTVNLTTKVDSLPLYSPSPGAPPRLVVPPRGRWSRRFLNTSRLRLYVRLRLWFVKWTS